MKKIVLLLIIQLVSLPIFSQQSLIKEAEEAYIEQDYRKAIELYEQLISIYGESAVIYYNLGNAYFEVNEIAPAILNYERALLLDPGDADTRYNLNVAKQRTVDNIVPIGEFFLVKWFNSLENTLSADSWGKMAVGSFILFIGCLILFFFSKWIRLKKTGFYVGIILLIFIIFANIFAYHQKSELVNRKSAIVFSPTVTVKSSPGVNSKDLFLIHEGTKLYIREKAGDWYEIELEDGSVGWIQITDMKII